MFASAKGKMLALEISPRGVRAVEYVPGTRPVRVTRAAAGELPGGAPVAVGRFLREFLAGKGFTAKRAVVGFLGPLIDHRVYALPPVGGESREELLRGKIAEEVSTPVAELRVSGEVVGKVVEQGVERHEVLAVFTPEFEIRRLVFILVEAGITPVRIVSVPLALAALHPAEETSSFAGFLHCDATHCVLGISDGGKLRLAREFTVEVPARAAAAETPDDRILGTPGESPEAKPPSADEEAAAERLVTELTRSLLYFRQLSRGSSISRIYWSGEPPAGAVVKLISQRLKLEIAPHPAETASAFVEGFPGGAAAFAVPVGLAASGLEAERVNLLPAEYLLRKKRRGNLAAVAVVSAAFLAANAGLYMGLRNAADRYRDVLSGLAVSTHRNIGMAEGFARWVALRKTVEDAAAGERALATPFARWRELFASLGAAAPKEMTFLSLSVDRAAEGYRGELRGKARGKDPFEAQDRINGFLAAVRRQGIASDARYLPVEVRPVAEGPGYEQEFLLVFRLGRNEGGGPR